MTTSEQQPRILFTIVPRRALRWLAGPLALVRSPLGKLLLWGGWLIGFGWAVHAGATAKLAWSPLPLVLVVPALAVATFLHELCHAAAAVAAGAPVPAIGVAARRGMGVYAYTDLSRVPRGPRARLAGVLLAGYDADALAMMLLLASAAAAPAGSVARGTLLLAHAGVAAATVLCFWPRSPFTDGGRLLRLLRMGRARPRVATAIHRAWVLGSVVTLGWVAVLLWRGELTWWPGAVR